MLCGSRHTVAGLFAARFLLSDAPGHWPSRMLFTYGMHSGWYHVARLMRIVCGC